MRWIEKCSENELHEFFVWCTSIRMISNSIKKFYRVLRKWQQIKINFHFEMENRNHLLARAYIECRKRWENLQFLTITYHRNKYWAVSGKQKSIFGCAIAISCSQAFEFIVVELPCLLVYRHSSTLQATTSSQSHSENLCIYGWTFGCIFYGIWMVCILHFIIYTIDGHGHVWISLVLHMP